MLPHIVAPLILGYVTDMLGDTIPGVSCTIAGGAICLLLLVVSLEDISATQ